MAAANKSDTSGGQISSNSPHQLQITDFFSADGDVSGSTNTHRTIIGALGNEALREYAAYINQLCGGKSTPGTVYSKLRVTRSSVTSRIIGQYLACTGGETTCHLLQDLTIWNEFLMLLNVELKELTPRKLGVVSLGSSSRGEWRNSDHYHSSILLHWLLKEHHCIKTLQLQQAVDQENSQILFDALRLNSGLTRLNLNDCGWPGDSSMQLITAVLTMTQLEELELTKVNVTSDALVYLADALEGMKHLKSLAIYFIDGAGHYMKPLLQGLSKNVTVKSLQVDYYCFAPGNDKVFGEYLAHNAILENLIIEHDYYGCHYAVVNVSALASALKVNKVLKKLRLGGFDHEVSRIKQFVEAMTKNSTLQHLHFSGLHWDFDANIFAELIEKNTGLLELEVSNSIPCSVAPVAAAIAQNVSMRKLTLKLSVATHEKAKLFLEALASNRTLELVTIGDVDETSVLDVYKLLQETGTEARVEFWAAFEEPLCLASTLKDCPKLTDISFESCEDLEPQLLLGGLEQLASCRHIVKLWLALDEDIGSDCAKSLASLLSSTKTLKECHLRLETTTQITDILLGGLSCNRSISLMFLEYWSFRHCHVGLLTAMLEGNMVLRDMTLESSDDQTSLSVLEMLPHCLLKNYSLLNVGMNMCLEFKRCMFEVRDILRRNLSFLNRAAEFVMGLHSKHSANAFECLYESETLASKVQDLTSETASEVQQRIRKTAAYLNVNFLAIVGVVADTVTCNRSDQVQFDQLGLDNWLKIRSYLRVSDIRDQGTTKCSVTSTRCSRKRKLC
ncbi:uncharacterized protein LOC115326745 [Ixodes scapularis]|uniref:uncharacterized protein LOC115326745 n=1 Tax=Ixodes scapularis TaxID=6945 RepID=UPI001A9E3F30|nr:uncharacterized protein LOC115326745 [Ixodes scapularis]